MAPTICPVGVARAIQTVTTQVAIVQAHAQEREEIGLDMMCATHKCLTNYL